jgi:hypothetical protein
MYKLLFVLLFVSSILSSCAQNTAGVTREGVVAYCDKFMQTFGQGKVSEAVLSLKDISVIPGDKINDLAAEAKKQMIGLGNTYGKMAGIELVSEKKVKEFLFRRLYIMRFDKYYLKFSFTAYKTSTGWAITGFKYNEDIEEFFN